MIQRRARASPPHTAAASLTALCIAAATMAQGGLWSSDAATGLLRATTITQSQTMRSGRSRRRARTTSLSGAWHGEYGYFGPPRERVPFVAVLQQTGATVRGTIEEPNTFGDPEDLELRALIAGERVGAFITFRKTYDGAGGQRHSVDYSGEISANDTRIDGLWRIGRRTGPFFMVRETPRSDTKGHGAAEAKP